MRLHILKHMRAHCWVCACACKHRSSLGTCAKSGTGLVSKSKTLPNWNKIRKARRSRKMMRMKTTTRRCLTVVVSSLSIPRSPPSCLLPPLSHNLWLHVCIRGRVNVSVFVCLCAPVRVCACMCDRKMFQDQKTVRVCVRVVGVTSSGESVSNKPFGRCRCSVEIRANRSLV